MLKITLCRFLGCVKTVTQTSTALQVWWFPSGIRHQTKDISLESPTNNSAATLAGVINSLRVSHGNDEMPTWSVTLRQVDNSDVVCEDRLWPGDLHQATGAVDDPCVVGTGHDLWHTLVCRSQTHDIVLY